jgi:hypothetical protein
MSGQPVQLDYAPPARSRFDWNAWGRFTLLFLPVVAVEAGCALLAHETVGEVASGGLFMIVLLTAGLTLIASFVHRRTAVIIAVIVALLIIPWHAYLGVKWWRQARESERIIAYVEARRAATGSYPADLSGYIARDRGIAETIVYSYDPRFTASFHIGYSIGSAGTAHTYTPEGGWFYYPD